MLGKLIFAFVKTSELKKCGTYHLVNKHAHSSTRNRADSRPLARVAALFSCTEERLRTLSLSLERVSTETPPPFKFLFHAAVSLISNLSFAYFLVSTSYNQICPNHE